MTSLKVKYLEVRKRRLRPLLDNPKLRRGQATLPDLEVARIETTVMTLSNMNKSALICGVLFLVVANAVWAQRGGKAEPNRIEFKPGTSTTTISGAVHNDEQAEYVLSARQGQRLIIKLTNVPAKSSCFDLKGPNQADVGLEYDCNWNYSKVLPATGDYFLVVARPSQSKGTSRYKMTITIR